VNLSASADRRGFTLALQVFGYHAQVIYRPQAEWRTAGVWKIARCGAADCDGGCRRCLESVGPRR
jgi:hypothetical protein